MFARRLVTAFVLVLAVPASALAAPEPQPYGTNDGGGFRDILPPGTNGRASALELGAFLTGGARPKHNDDQLSMYGDLVYATPGLPESDLPKYFKDNTFGVKAAERTYSPREDVTVVRDSAFGEPHIYGADRTGAMFGIGYATAEDRLFFIDVLRHYGRAELSSFAGGANIEMDREQWRVAPYTEADLEKQIKYGVEAYGELGALVKSDADAYIAGINAYIAEAKLNPTLMPGEYAAIGRPQGPDPFKVTDIVSIASLVGGIFGKGGGGEVSSSLTRQSFLARFGPRRGARAWRDFRSIEDPEAPTTSRKRVDFQQVPKDPQGVSIPDAGSYTPDPIVVSTTAEGKQRAGAEPLLSEGLRTSIRGRGASNFMVVSARESATGRPIAVMGPQVSYFAPQILMEQDVHAPSVPGKPGIDATGAAFPGVNLYVELGRGRDYAWSATSAGNDVIDTFALPLCDPDQGTTPTLGATGYAFRGRCERFEELVRTNSWSPTAADQTPAGSETIRSLRTKLGVVTGRGLVKGKPVAFVYNRTTYMHEVDNASAGFMALNTPEMIKSPQDFQQAAFRIGYTFNWVYADSKHIAYFNSGDTPARNPRHDPRFPVDGSLEWQNYDPENNTMRLARFEQHPRGIDERYFASWNGKQAPGYRANDSNYAYGPVDRVQTLSRRVDGLIKGKRKTTVAEVVNAVEDAGTVDLRGQEVLRWVFRVMARERDPQVIQALARLRDWVVSGAHRRDRNRDGTYDDADAVALMDAWWPKLLEAQFLPALGRDAFDALRRSQQFHDDPHGHLGSAFDDGWYGFVQKDLRMILGRKVRGRWSRTYCGGTLRRNGSRKRCSAALARSLKAALPVAADRNKLYSGDPSCEAGDQICWDEVRFRPLGGITQPPIHWINRPTYQQVVSVERTVPRDPGSPFTYPARGQ